MSTKREPWHPALYEKEEMHAIKALFRGDASPEQQKTAIVWIVWKAAQTGDQSFYPANAHVTDFLEGRRSVGNQILKLRDLRLDSANSEQPV